jgi:hypothetical protein
MPRQNEARIEVVCVSVDAWMTTLSFWSQTNSQHRNNANQKTRFLLRNCDRHAVRDGGAGSATEVEKRFARESG